MCNLEIRAQRAQNLTGSRAARACAGPRLGARCGARGGAGSGPCHYVATGPARKFANNIHCQACCGQLVGTHAPRAMRPPKPQGPLPSPPCPRSLDSWAGTRRTFVAGPGHSVTRSLVGLVLLECLQIEIVSQCQSTTSRRFSGGSRRFSGLWSRPRPLEVRERHMSLRVCWDTVLHTFQLSKPSHGHSNHS